jgi:apolipoprotein N-acyltransferase
MLLLTSLLTGLLLAASYPQVNQGYLAWVALIPLISYVFKAPTCLRAFWGGLIAGAISLFALMIWIPQVLAHFGGLHTALAWLAFVLLVCLLACYPAAACVLTKYLMMRGGERFFLLFPAVWVLFEYAQSFSPFGGLPWLLTGYTQSDYLGIIQIADITGIYGISFVVLCAGTSTVWLVFKRDKKLLASTPFVAAVLLVVACLLYGKISLNRWESTQGEFSAAMLQGNISYDDPEEALDERFQRGYIQMADSMTREKIDLLVIPESPTPLSILYGSTYQDALAKIAGRYSLGLIFNNVRSEESGDSLRYFNSAYFLDRNGTLTGIYDKMHLVPFGEYIPLKKIFFFIEMISKDVDSFNPGKDYRVLNVGHQPANAIICFEAVFPDLVRRFVRRGSRLIINLTNDAWYGDSAAPYQHLAIARLRAVENRRYLLRATNSGISAIISPSGRIQSSTGLLQEAICKGRFSFLAEKTFYTRYGDVFVFLCAIISLGSWIFAGFYRPRTRNK